MLVETWWVYYHVMDTKEQVVVSPSFVEDCSDLLGDNNITNGLLIVILVTLLAPHPRTYTNTSWL